MPSQVRLPLPYCYFIVQARFNSAHLPFPLTTDVVSVVVQKAVTELHGVSEGSREVAILQVNNEKQTFIVRVHHEHYMKLHSALTVCSDMVIAGKSLPVAFRVLEPVARTLPALAGVMRDS